MTLKSDSKKSYFLRNMRFLCDAIDLKQSMAKSLTTVLDEVHFMLNLYSFPQPLVPQVNPFSPKVSHLSPPRWNNFQNFPLLFLLTPLLRYLSS